MTILPKKKQNKNNVVNNDEDKEHSNERYSYGQISSSNQNGQISPNNRTWSSRNDDKRPAPDVDCPSDHSAIGNSHLKRRHRTNRDRDVSSDLQRSLISSVRTISKSSMNSPSSSHDISNSDNDLAIPGCSGIRNREESDIPHPGLLVPVGIALGEEDEDKKDISGYNSGDEYHKPSEHWNNIDWEEKERSFERKIRKIGLMIKKMCEDGACLFRAVADQVYGDQEMHASVRKLCMDYMEKNCDYFSQYVTENFPDYVERKRSDHIHGNHVEIQALSEIFNRPIQVYHYSAEPINIFQGCQQAESEPIRISYHRNVHYNSIIDPYKATIGVGLGLPGYKPGLAEKSLMEKAVRISEQHELEQAMLEDKIRATDWEATSEAIEEQIARESYLEWLRESEMRSRKKTSATSTLTEYAAHHTIEDTSPNTSSSKCFAPRTSKSPLNDRDLRSPKRANAMKCTNDKAENVNLICSPKDTRIDSPIDKNSSFMQQVPPTVLGLNDWEDEDDILARVLAQSQAEYIQSLKHSVSNVTATPPAQATTPANSVDDYSTSLPSTSSSYQS